MEGVIMNQYIYKLVIYFCCFGVAMYALGALNYEKFLRVGRTVQAQVLFIVLAMCIALLMGDFLINLIYYFR
jgi:uncharacterized membrane protein YwzB